jgi:hypothetical protein
MPSRNHEVPTISRFELPQLLAQWQREKRSGLALLPGDYPFDGYVENGWKLEETNPFHGMTSCLSSHAQVFDGWPCWV